MYRKREYQNLVYNPNFVQFKVQYFESDLLICAKKDLKIKAQKLLIEAHDQIKGYIDKNPVFKSSLIPIELDKTAPHIIAKMIKASQKANVGPMATVAGVIAECLGKQLLKDSDEIIIENGGDIFISVKTKTRIGIFAGLGNIFNRLVLLLSPEDTPCGICTSSGIIGHSLSFGKTNATTVIAKSAAQADAFATAIGNIVNNDTDIPNALKIARNNPLIKGLIIIIDSSLASYGKVTFDIA